MKFKQFDTRHLRTLPVRRGYALWSDGYDREMKGMPMDTMLLDRLPRRTFRGVRTAVDLGCGTGRMGAWLRTRGVRTVDGVDATPAMLARARRKRIYRRLRVGDLLAAGGARGAYDLAIASLVACHLSDLGRLYRTMRALTSAAGQAVVVDYHPHFLLNGIPTKFVSRAGDGLAIVNHVHLLSDHVRAALRAGWRVAALDELKVPAGVVKQNAAWKKYVNRPIAFLLHLERAR